VSKISFFFFFFFFSFLLWMILRCSVPYGVVSRPSRLAEVTTIRMRDTFIIGHRRVQLLQALSRGYAVRGAAGEKQKLVYGNGTAVRRGATRLPTLFAECSQCSRVLLG
jgi:hypothetical protein